MVIPTTGLPFSAPSHFSHTASGLATSLVILPVSSPLAASVISTSALGCLVSSSMVFQVPPAPAARARLLHTVRAVSVASFANVFISTPSYCVLGVRHPSCHQTPVSSYGSSRSAESYQRTATASMAGRSARAVAGVSATSQRAATMKKGSLRCLHSGKGPALGQAKHALGNRLHFAAHLH